MRVICVLARRCSRKDAFIATHMIFLDEGCTGAETAFGGIAPVEAVPRIRLWRSGVQAKNGTGVERRDADALQRNQYTMSS